MEWIPLIAVVLLWILGSIYAGVRGVRRVRENPDLGPIRAERYSWQDSLRGATPARPGIRHDPGGEVFGDAEGPF